MSNIVIIKRMSVLPRVEGRFRVDTGISQPVADVFAAAASQSAIQLAPGRVPGARIAVGMLITEHPPHRSRRAQFGHRAPTSGA
ncbi:protein of unknown function [Paraburkholderia kururiensis]